MNLKNLNNILNFVLYKLYLKTNSFGFSFNIFLAHNFKFFLRHTCFISCRKILAYTEIQKAGLVSLKD